MANKPAKTKRVNTASLKGTSALTSISFKNKVVNNFGLLVYLSGILFTSSLFISSLLIGGVTWDEVYGLRMIQTHFTTAFNNIPLASDPGSELLIYYGIIQLLPGYILSLIFDAYHTCSHVTIFIMSLIASLYIYKLAKLIGLRRNIAYISSTLLLLYPIWLGHSFFNDKDLPAAVFFTIYSYYVCKILNVGSMGDKINKRLSLKLILSGALLAGTKFAFFPIIVVDSVLIIFFYKDKILSKLFFSTAIIVLTLLLTIIFTPGAWHQPATYIINDIVLMGKFAWIGCTHLLNQCIVTNSLEWSAAKYLLSWYLVQMPLLFILLFASGIFSVGKVFLSRGYMAVKAMWAVLLLQLLFIPLLAVIRNSTLYDATRHTLFCIPIIILISGFGLEFIFKIAVKRRARTALISGFSLLLLWVIVDNILLNPYEYSYFNELARYSINDKNTDTDYWGFSLRETYEKIDQMKYYTPYISMENGPLPETLTPFMSGNYQFVHYDKDIQVPLNTSVNVIGLVRGNYIDNQINPSRCTLISETSRALLFKPDRLSMSKAYNCK